MDTKLSTNFGIWPLQVNRPIALPQVCQLVTRFTEVGL